MTDILAKICTTKREEIAAEKMQISLHELEQIVATQTPPRGFANALQTAHAQKRVGLIAEIKKASPSHGLIRADFDATQLASAYSQGGATCLSVLTDAPYFQGAADYLKSARASCDLPVLRKDFMLDTYQMAQARAWGADAVLLIMAALSPAHAQELEAAATHYGLDVLVEVHDEAELDTALRYLKSPLMGVNNRNLKTLVVDLATSERLAAQIPNDRIAICESGIQSHSDIVRMQASGIYGFLVGESLMRQADVTRATRTLLGI